jgi:hypothetical protein
MVVVGENETDEEREEEHEDTEKEQDSAMGPTETRSATTRSATTSLGRVIPGGILFKNKNYYFRYTNSHKFKRLLSLE